MYKKMLFSVCIFSLVLAPFAAFSEDDQGKAKKVVEFPEVVVLGTPLYSPGVNEVPVGESEAGLPGDSGELLRSVPGVSGVRMGGHGIDPVIRGQIGARINILLDGVYIYGGCPNRMDPPGSYAPIESYDRIVVLKGPRSIAQSGGSGGTVLFERRTPALEPGQDWRGRFSTSYADNGARSGLSVDVAGGIPKAYLRAIYNRTEADSYKDGDRDKVPSAFTSKHAAFLTGWLPNDNFRMDFSWETVDTDDVLYPGAGMDAPISDSEIFRAKVQWQDDQNRLSGFKAEYYQSAVEHTMDNYSLRTLAAPKPLKTETTSDTIGGRVVVNLSHRSTHWTFGGEFQNNIRNAVRYVGPDKNNVGTVQSVLWPEASITQYGAFGNLEMDLHENLSLALGLRYDRIEVSTEDADRDPPGGPMSPEALYQLYYHEDADDRTEDNLGALVRLEAYTGKKSPIIFLDLSRTVRTADATERFMAANGMTPQMRWIGNPEIDPEVHYQVQAGFLHRTDDWQVSAAAYYDWASDYIIRDRARGKHGIKQDDGAAIYRNVDVELLGGELETRWNWTESLSNRIALSYVYANNTTDKMPVAQIPPFAADVGLHYERPEWNMGAKLRMTAEQTRVDDDPKDGSGLDTGRTPGYGVVDLYGQVSLIKNIDLQAGVNNLLDHTYAEHLNKPNAFDPDEVQVNEPGRVLWVKLVANH